jgi:hypothetical protein
MSRYSKENQFVNTDESPRNYVRTPPGLLLASVFGSLAVGLLTGWLVWGGGAPGGPVVCEAAAPALPALQAPFAKKGLCTQYFGADVNSTSTSGVLYTVADTDVHDGFPFGDATFIHHSGPGSLCKAPGPPKGCHRYYVASYESARCASSCQLINGRAKKLAGTMDTGGAFDRSAGVLKGCEGCVQSVAIRCWAAPSSNPVPCRCPGAV